MSPTYVLEDHLDNFITSRELIDKLSDKAETWRLGNENSEDALSFNVFRSLQHGCADQAVGQADQGGRGEGGLLTEAARLLSGHDLDGEPELIVWGYRLGQTTVEPVAELKTALDPLEGTWVSRPSPRRFQSSRCAMLPSPRGRKVAVVWWMPSANEPVSRPLQRGRGRALS